MTKSHHDQLSRIRFLTLSLFVSGSFNLLLLALLCFWAMQEKPIAPFIPTKTGGEISLNEELLKHYRTLPFETLIGKLQQPSEREIALTALVAEYDFDIKRALCSSMHPLKSQILLCRNGERLLTFPSLKEEQVLLILDFVKKERWPLKAKGLFALLKDEKYKHEKSLREAFLSVEEFAILKGCNESDILLNIIRENSWEFFIKTIKRSDTSANFLLEYVKNGSSFAAAALIKWDWNFVISRLPDESLMVFLQVLNDQEALDKLSNHIISSPRGEPLRSLAQKKGGRNFIQEKVLTKLKPLSNATYTVQEGDSLWKIAKKHQVEVDNLKKINYLSSDILQPGTVLRIPI